MSTATLQSDDGPSAFVSLFQLMMGMSAEQWDALGRDRDEDDQDGSQPLG